jgi:hypothetical protein
MRVDDEKLDELRTQGYTIIPGFLASDELAAAQEALWLLFPKPEDYFRAPEEHEQFSRSQFAGLRNGPWPSWDLNRLAFHPDLIDAAERFLGSTDLRLYKTELWAKYAGAIDYDQHHHRDFGNHSLVVPSRRQPATQMTTFTLLSDVTEEDGPTKLVPLPVGEDVPYWPNRLPQGAFADEEVSVTGPAGTLFIYRTDILHRGSQITGERSSRFMLLADYEVWGNRWTGKTAWPNTSLNAAWTEMIERASPRERDLFGFPSVGDPYWDPQTLADTQLRYPNMDLTSYQL